MTFGAGLALCQERLHLVDHKHRWRVLRRLSEYIRDLFAGFVDVRAGNAKRVDFESWPTQILNQLIDGKGFSTSRWAMKDDRRRKTYAKCRVALLVPDDIYNVFVKKRLEFRTTMEFESLARNFAVLPGRNLLRHV